MRTRKWLYALVAMIFAVSILAVPAIAQGHSKEHGNGHVRSMKGEEHGNSKGKKAKKGYYSERNREELHAWYRHHEGSLPPGLAKKDRLPPGLERQLRVNGTLPPGLQREAHKCPREIEQYLPPPPPNCDHVLIGGQIVLWNRRTHIVLDIMKLF